MQEPEKQVSVAKIEIDKLPGTAILRESSLITCAPYGNKDQADFVNQVLEVESSLSPLELLSALLSIEANMGRIRKEKWGARLIDIDILMAGAEVICHEEDGDGPELKVPHPDFHNRLFTLELLNELCPDAKHPVLHETISELYGHLLKSGGKP